MNIQITLAKNAETEEVLESIIEKVLFDENYFVFGELIQASPIIYK